MRRQICALCTRESPTHYCKTCWGMLSEAERKELTTLCASYQRALMHLNRRKLEAEVELTPLAIARVKAATLSENSARLALWNAEAKTNTVLREVEENQQISGPGPYDF